jgi:hypothetical protein
MAFDEVEDESSFLRFYPDKTVVSCSQSGPSWRHVLVVEALRLRNPWGRLGHGRIDFGPMSARGPGFAASLWTRVLLVLIWTSGRVVSHVVDLYIARQPIFDATRDVVGYELLFRDGLSNCFTGMDGTEATRQVLLNTFVLFGLTRLTGGRPAFINFTRDFLFNDLVCLFPPNNVVVEILEDIPADFAVRAACRRLKDAGYTLALDDVTSIDAYGDLIGLVDIVKVDFRKTPEEDRHRMVKKLLGTSVRLLAEKVET